MAFVIADRVRETTTTIGTGSVTLGGAYTSFQTFSAAIGNGNNTYYTIASVSSGEWEVGIGTYASGGNLLSRDTVLASSNAGNLVNFSVGSKDVFVTQPSERSLLLNSGSTGLFAGNAAFTANGLLYANATTTATTSSALTFDGTTLTASASASASGNFKTTSTSAQVYNLTASNDANTTIGLGVFGSAAGTFGTLSAGTPFLSTSAATMVQNVQNASGVFVWGIGATPAEQMRLTSTGLGIGTSSPSNKLVVSNAGAAGFEFDPANGVMQTYNRSGGAYTATNLLALQINFKTGSSPATNMVLDSSGNLGIGTSSPAYKLDVNGAINTSADLISQGNNARLSLYRSTGINYFDWASGQALYFSTQTSAGGGGRSTLMVLDSSGNLGIGTSTPGAKLDVVGAGTFRVDGSGSTTPLILRNNNTASTQVVKLGFDSNGAIKASINAAVYGNDYMTFNVGSDTERMRLDASGNLGLGVTPSAWWSGSKAMQIGLGGFVQGRTGTASAVEIGANQFINSGIQRTYINSDFATYYEQSAGQHIWFRAPSGTAGNAISFTQAMTLDASGNLAVGNTSPSAWLYNGLSAGSGAADAGITVYSGSSSDGILAFADGTSGTTRYEGYVYYSHSTNSLRFGTGATERARIDSSGNLGVGSTSITPAYGYSRVIEVAGNFPGIKFAPSGSSTFGFQIGAGTLGFQFYDVTAGAERARIDSSGNLLVGKTSADTTTAGNMITASYMSSAGTQDYWLAYNTSAAAYRFYVSAAGTISATSTTISAISDQRLKENVRDLDDGLDAIMALKPRKFDWKAGKGKDIKDDRGFVAQEFEQVFPDMIDNWKDPAPEGEEPYKAVRADLIPILVKAIQELKAEFDAYKATHP